MAKTGKAATWSAVRLACIPCMLTARAYQMVGCHLDKRAARRRTKGVPSCHDGAIIAKAIDDKVAPVLSFDRKRQNLRLVARLHGHHAGKSVWAKSLRFPISFTFEAKPPV